MPSFLQAKPKSETKKILLIGGSVLGVVVVGVLGFLLYTTQGNLLNVFRDKDVIAKVGDKNITKTDLNEQLYGQEFKGSISAPPETSIEKKKEILGKLIEWTISEIEAEKQGITVSDEEVMAKIKTRGDYYNNLTDQQKKLVEKTIKKELTVFKVKDKVLGSKEGKYIVIHFDYNLAPDTQLSEAERAKLEPTREQRAKEEKEYADQLAKTIYANIKSGKITFEQAMEQVKNDPKTGTEYFKKLGYTGLQPGSFTKEEYQENKILFIHSEVKEKAINTKVGEITEPFIAKVDVTTQLGKEESKDGLYFILKIEKGEDGKNITYEDWLKNKKDELKVEIFDKSLVLNNGGQKGLISEASAHGGGHGPGQTDHWGVNTGRAQNNSGLIVRTYYYEANGAGPYFYNTRVRIISNAGTVYTPNRWWGEGGDPRYSDAWFWTGGAYYWDGVGGAADAWAGHLVLGGGVSSSSWYASHGNGYTISCLGNNFQVIPVDNGPGNGYWSYLPGAFGIANGYTYGSDLVWQKTEPPNLSITKQVKNSAGTWGTVGKNAAPGDVIEYRLRVTNNGGVGHNVIVEDEIPTYTTYVSGATGMNAGAFPGHGGVNHAYFLLGNFAGHTSADYYFNVRVNSTGIPASGTTITNHGHVRADDNAMRNSNNVTTTVPPHQLTCGALTPQPVSGSVPLVVRFIAATLEDDWHHPVTQYQWDFDGNGTIDQVTGRGETTVNYTFASVGEYTSTVRPSTGESIPEISCPSNVRVNSKPWSESDMKEVAP